MGRIGRLLSFAFATRNGAKVGDAKIDPGGGPNLTVEHFSSPGDDSYPLPGDYVATVATKNTGRESCIGYIDPANAQLAAAGEKRIYARDGNGATTVELWLKNTGEAVLANVNGSITLEAGGDVVINGVRISPSGNITDATTLEVGGKELNNHTHPITSGSSAPGPTGPNNP